MSTSPCPEHMNVTWQRRIKVADYKYLESEMTLDYPGGPDLISRTLKWGQGEHKKNQREM